MSPGRIYVASPLGFTEPGTRYLNDVLHPALEAAGLTVLDPWADPDGSVSEVLARPVDDPERPGALVALNRRLGARNAALIESASAVLAVLDGSDVDSGTAAEIGFAAARSCPVVGLRTDSRLSGDNEAAQVNLQVLSFIEASGGSIHADLDGALEELGALASSRADRFIYHLTLRAEWDRALREGDYRRSTREASLDEVGYLHASFRRQLVRTATRFYADVPAGELILLEVDRNRLRAPLKVEEAAEGSDAFPHIYGPLNLDAVVAVRFNAREFLDTLAGP